MLKKTLALTAVSLIFSGNVLAKVETYPAAAVCEESIVHRSAAVKKALASGESLDKIIKYLATEEVGADAQTYGFSFTPLFARSERKFVCNIPLSDEIGNFKLNIHAYIKNMKPAHGGCFFSRSFRMHDGGDWKVMPSQENGSLNWTSLKNNDGFVNYSQYIDNEYARSTSLQIKCRTTYNQGSLLLQHIELEY